MVQRELLTVDVTGLDFNQIMQIKELIDCTLHVESQEPGKAWMGTDDRTVKFEKRDE